LLRSGVLFFARLVGISAEADGGPHRAYSFLRYTYICKRN